MSGKYKSKLPHTPVTLQDKIAQMYYRHGVFCASHPYIIMVITLVILTFCCYPVLYLPLLGSSSQQFTTPIQDHMPPGSNSDHVSDRAPWWFQGPPVAFVQQIIVKSVVMPWKTGLILTDAFRGPLAEAFNILETIRNHHTDGDNTTTLADICLQVSEPLDKHCQALPQYGCLILSPAHMWTQDVNRFQQDPDIIKTIFKFRDVIPDSCNLRDVLFGVPWKETGIKKLNMRTRPRILTYAITIIMKELDLEFVHSLHKKLQEKYSFLPYPENVTYSPKDSNIAHVQFRDQYTVAEFVPLGVTYIILFLYIYFSVRKIEMVKSKWVLAVSAVTTLLMSLFMSVGLCLWFGLHPTLNGSEILPYLIVVIGLENMLVLTKSVVSTPDHLDTKLRLAQGLSREGWSITKNLFTELALLTFAFFTFVPAIQEFCLFAVVGLLSDFFLQLVFFITALSIGIGRTEMTDSYRDGMQQIKLMNSKFQQPLNSEPFSHRTNSSNSTNLHSTKFGSTHLKSPFVSHQNNRHDTTPILRKIPKRLKFVYFWARTRMVQRALMVCLVFWVLLFVYKSGIVSHLADNTTRLGPAIAEQVVQPLFFTLTGGSIKSENGEEEDKDNISDWQSSTVKFRLQHHNLNNWKALPSHHWAMLFGYYNISLSGSYISILPTFHLCIPIDPNVALKLRHPADINFEKIKENFLDASEIDDSAVVDMLYHPSSPAEVALAFTLSIPSLIFFIYLMVLLYRCMCSRHYAEWRSSWHQKTGSNPKESDRYFVSETFPIKLQGHTYEVENFVAEENVVVSACLAGDICIWDALSGECLKVIKRSKRSLNKIESSSTIAKDENTCSVSNNNSSTTIQCETAIKTKSLEAPCVPKNNGISFKCPNDIYLDLKSENSQGYDFSKFCKCVQSRQKQSPDIVENDLEKTPTFISKDTQQLQQHQSGLYSRSSPDLEYKKDASVQNSPLPYQSIWCLDCNRNRLVIGCSEGRIEVWDTTAGVLKCTYEDNDSGVTSICLTENRITAARLNGTLEYFLLNSIGNCIDDSSKKRNGIIHCLDSQESPHWECMWLHTIHAHSQPITRLVTGGGHVITGSQDHLVKIFRSESPVCLYTLHGHSGGVTALHIDQSTSSSAASGCQDGMICVWDLMTGTCVYSLEAHRGAIMTLLTSYMYVISYGADDCMCIWEKCQGHHLYTIHQPHSICSDVVLLTNNIIVTAKEDHLVLWDVNHGGILQMISLGSYEQGAFVRELKLAGRALVCDYGSQLFIIHFPAIREKGE